MYAKLKLLIVDDEPLSRKRISSFQLKDCPFEIAAEAEDGQEALEKVERIRPDIVVTDIVMPVMNGLELLRELQKRPDPPKVVILTCHEDFDKAQLALRLGAEDYIVKMMLREEDFKKCICRIADLIVNERQERSQLLVNMVGKIMRAGTPAEAAPSLDKLYSMHFVMHSWRLVRLYGGTCLLQGVREEEEDNLCLPLDDSSRCLTYLQYSLSPISKESFETETRAFVGRLCREANACKKAVSETYHVVAGVVCREAAMLSEAAASMDRFEDSLFYEDYRNEAYFQDPQIEPFGIFPQDEFLEMLETCRQYCRSGNYDRLGFCWSGWLEALKRYRPLPQAVHDMLGFAASYLSGLLSEIRFEGQPICLWMKSRLVHAETLLDVENCFAAAADFLSHSPGPTTKAMRNEIQNALEYIQENYTRKISLKSAARHVQLSESWFGALFREETHQSFSEYLISYRLAKAKELLKDSDMTVSQISEAVGIQDPHYFTRIFTERNGAGPKSFRQEAQGKTGSPAEEKQA